MTHEKKRLKVTDKYTGEIIAEIDMDSIEDLRRKIKKAREEQKNISNKSFEERIEFFRSLGKLIRRKSREVLEILAKEGGIPLKYGRIVLRTITQAMLVIDYYADLIREKDVESFKGRGKIIYEPVGVVGGITPRNAPLFLPSYIMGTSLISGNSVVLKPSTKTPLVALKLREFVKEVDDSIPIEVGILSGIEAAREFVLNPLIDAIVLYGSTTTGKDLLIQFGKYLESTKTSFYGAVFISGKLKKIVLEMAGNDAGIVMSDVDVEDVAKKIVRGAFTNAGQQCISFKRIIVHEDISNQFIEVLKDEVSKLVVGNPLNESTDIGPIGSENALNIIDFMVKDAEKRGGEKIIEGKREDPFFTPTLIKFDKSLILGKSEEEKPFLWREEAFGPVRSIVEFSTMGEAIKLANDCKYGLRAGVYSGDMDVAMKMARELEVSSVIINEDPQYFDVSMMFGGVKDSGIGGAEYMVLHLTNKKYVHIA